jgi:hypothetical protein
MSAFHQAAAFEKRIVAAFGGRFVRIQARHRSVNNDRTLRGDGNHAVGIFVTQSI